MVRRRGNLIENSKGSSKCIVTLQKIKGTLTFKLGKQNEKANETKGVSSELRSSDCAGKEERI